MTAVDAVTVQFVNGLGVSGKRLSVCWRKNAASG